MLKPPTHCWTSLAATASSALAQVPASQVRQPTTAWKPSGGLSNYFTEEGMHRSGGGDCLVEDNANGYLFTLGGAPGWEVNRKPATVQTKILIGPEGTTKQVVYNGAPQQEQHPWLAQGALGDQARQVTSSAREKALAEVMLNYPGDLLSRRLP